VDKLQQLFLDETLAKIPKINEAINVLRNEPRNKTCLKILHVFFHTLYGTGSTVGFNEWVKNAKNFEDKLFLLIESKQAIEANFLEEIENMVISLAEGIGRLKIAGNTKTAGEQTVLPLPGKEVLVVDDDTVIRQMITEELSKKNFRVTGAGDTNEARKVLERYRPDLIILDIVMPGTSGLDLLKELRRDPRLKWTPIFFLTGKSNPEEIIEGIKSGADDYIIKPFNVEDLIARVESKIQRMEELHGIAVRDPLTGIFSRNYFMERLQEEIERFQRQKKPFSLAMCDLDFFKIVNDEYGHQAGDFVLKQFASFLYNSFRRTDTVGRYGGEEFIVLMPETDVSTACRVLERLRSNWEKKSITEPYGNKKIYITFSSGIAEFDRDGKNKQEIIKAADNALYQAKATGRNKVVLASQVNSNIPFSLPKILVVDDSSVVRDLLLKELKKDYQVFLAHNGEEALIKLYTVKPDLVITDLVMPAMGGLELIKKVRENPQNKHIKIIALTSDTLKKTLVEAFQAGADDYVVKPFDQQELAARISRLLKRRY